MNIFARFACRLFRGALPRAAAAATAAVSSVDSAVAWSSKEIHDHVQGLTLCEEELLARALPEDHPDAVRASRVAADLVSAASRDEVFGRRRLSERTGHRVTGHGAAVNWRLHVIDDDEWLYAYSYPTGEIVVSTVFVNSLCREDDARLATVLGHEIAHQIGRHTVDYFRKGFWASILASYVDILLEAPVDRIPRDKWKFLFMRPWYQKMEKEADRVGLMLQAAAGYDPRASPTTLEATAPMEDDYDEEQWFHNRHPLVKIRVALLRQEHMMGDAMEVFHEAVERHVCCTSSSMSHGDHNDDEDELPPNLTINA